MLAGAWVKVWVHLPLWYGKVSTLRLWHVDHIIPCTAFDLTVDENQRICFWYKNLQPMWAKENLQKSNTYTEEEKQALISAYCNQ